MNPLGTNLIAFAMATLLGLGGAFPGAAADRKPGLRVIYDASRLSVEARGISLRRVLEEIGAKVGFSVMEYGVSDKPLTVSIQDASLEDVLNEILRGENYAFVYRGQGRAIETVILLSSSTTSQTTAANQPQTDKNPEGTVPSQAELTYYHSVSPPSPFGEQKRAEKAEPEVRVEDIMRAHALSGLIDPIGSLSGTVNLSQPFGSPAGNSFATGATSTNRAPQDINETLAITTRLAQQNLKALVDGLATATNSLFQSLPNSAR
jgi:hypothetical protein